MSPSQRQRQRAPQPKARSAVHPVPEGMGQATARHPRRPRVRLRMTNYNGLNMCTIVYNKEMFRIQYKTIGLTYSKCNAERKEMVDFIQSKLPLEEYYCVRETHDPKKEGFSPDFPYHLHVWFKLPTKPNIKNPRIFDYKGCHPNIGKKQRNWVYNYLQKQDKEPYTNIPDGYIELAKAGRYDDAVSRFQAVHPKEFVINMPRVLQNLRRIGRPDHRDKIYPLTENHWMPDWDPAEKSLWVVFESQKGKTEWAKTYVTHHLKKSYLRVTHLDTLKTWNGEEVIIYDDCSFAHLPRETCIHIAETKNSRQIHCRHANACLPPGIANIFLSNVENIWPTDYSGAIMNRLLMLAPSIRFY